MSSRTYIHLFISPSLRSTFHPVCTPQFSSLQQWRKTVTTIVAANSTPPDTCGLFTDPDKWRVLCADETRWRCESAICHSHKQILLLLLQSFRAVHKKHKFPLSFHGGRQICRIDSPHLPALSVTAAVLRDAIKRILFIALHTVLRLPWLRLLVSWQPLATEVRFAFTEQASQIAKKHILKRSRALHRKKKLWHHYSSICTQWRSWMRHCATSRKVAGSIPDGVIGIFHWRNRSGRTMALGFTQPLTEMSARNISWGGKGGRCVGLTTLPPSCADCLEIWEPQPPGTLRACPGL